jgi:hypothetical protein
MATVEALLSLATGVDRAGGAQREASLATALARCLLHQHGADPGAGAPPHPPTLCRAGALDAMRGSAAVARIPVAVVLAHAARLLASDEGLRYGGG